MTTSVLTMIKKLDLLKPSREEMLKEISESGLRISLENGNVDFLTKHKDELICTMWKVVKMSQLVGPEDAHILFDNSFLHKTPRRAN